MALSSTIRKGSHKGTFEDKAMNEKMILDCEGRTKHPPNRGAQTAWLAKKISLGGYLVKATLLGPGAIYQRMWERYEGGPVPRAFNAIPKKKVRRIDPTRFSGKALEDVRV